MVQNIIRKSRKNALKFLAFQFFIALIASVTVGLIWEVQTGQSFFIGAMLDVLPSFVFTIYAFRFTGAQRLHQVAASFYRGETVKILITGAALVFIMQNIPVVFPALFTGFLMMKISQFLQSIFF